LGCRKFKLTGRIPVVSLHFVVGRFSFFPLWLSECNLSAGAPCIEERWIITLTLARKTLKGPHTPGVSSGAAGEAPSDVAAPLLTPGGGQVDARTKRKNLALGKTPQTASPRAGKPFAGSPLLALVFLQGPHTTGAERRRGQCEGHTWHSRCPTPPPCTGGSGSPSRESGAFTNEALCLAATFFAPIGSYFGKFRSF